jgi:SAM-dependent methyltransferase
VDTVSILMWAVAIVGGLFAAYLVLHYALFLLMAHPKDASDYGLGLNEFERRQLVEWAPRQEDFLKHDDEDRTYDDVFGTYRDIDMNYSTCVFPRAPFSNDNEVENRLLEPKEGMRILELGCGAGATAHDFASRHNVKIVCVTNSAVQTEICRKKFAKFGGRVSVITTDFDKLDLPAESFDAIYAFESIGYTKNLDAWLARCLRMLKPGGRLLIRSPGGLDHCRREVDFQSVSDFFYNWHYNFLGANLIIYKMRQVGFGPIRYRQVPFWAWGLTWNYVQLMWLWKFKLKMRTFVNLERIIWRTSKAFVYGNPYNLVLAFKPVAVSGASLRALTSSPSVAASSSPLPAAASTSQAG